MNTCPQCGAQAAAGQSFCRHCGTALQAGGSLEAGAPQPQPQDTGATSGHATAEMTGRSCPYCRFPLKEGSPITECGTCHTVHHAECWEENGGCSITGCAGGPTLATQVHTPSSAATPPAPAQAPPAAVPSQARLPAQMPVALAATLAVVVAILGAAAALALSSGKGGGSPTASAPPIVTQTTQSTLSASSEAEATVSADTETQATEAEDTETETTSSEEATQAAAPSNESQTESPLGAVNEHWHDLQSGDYQAAWSDEAPSLRGNRSSWVHGQEEAGIESIDYRFKEGSRSGDGATVQIEELRTVSHQNGCQNWTGTYGLIDEGGRWEISDAASLRSHRC